LLRKIEKSGIDALVIGKKSNVYYLTGLNPVSDVALLVKRDGEIKIYGPRLDFFDLGDFLEEIKIETERGEKNPFQVMAEEIGKLKYIETDEYAGTIVQGVIENSHLLIKTGNNFVESLRRTKDEEEIALIKKSCFHTKDIMEEIISNIKPGMTEIEVSKIIERKIVEMGYEKAFDILVASGPRSAVPHGKPTKKRIEDGDLLVIDMGISIEGYKSDMTRTIVVGSKDERKIEVIETVRKAHDVAIEKIKEGIRIPELCKQASEEIEKRGLKEYELHSLGHGVGLDIHEEPSVSKKNDDFLRSGDVITVEPGVYIKGFGGARWEDTVLVKKDGYEILTI